MLLLLLLLAAALVPATSQALGRKPHCRAGQTAHIVRVRVHHRVHGRLRASWVREWRCVASRHPGPPGAAAPTVHYSAHVDPTFSQSPSNPLAVAYSYSADATATSGAVSTDLATVGQLPAGVLNFYSEQTPGGPELLYCSMNVGGDVSGDSCPISYPATGSYQVTTQYVPNGIAATTQTETETIAAFTTTPQLNIAPTSCPGWPSFLQLAPGAKENCYAISVSVADQNGTALSGHASVKIGDRDDGDVTIGSTCTIEVASAGTLTAVAAVHSPDCPEISDRPLGSFVGDFPQGASVASWSIAASYAGSPGWAPSTSPASSVSASSPVGS